MHLVGQLLMQSSHPSLFLLHVRYSSPPWLYVILHFSHNRFNWSSPFFATHFRPVHYLWSSVRNVQVSSAYKLCSERLVLAHELLTNVTQTTKRHWDILSPRLPVSIRQLPVRQFSMPILNHLPLRLCIPDMAVYLRDHNGLSGAQFILGSWLSSSYWYYWSARPLPFFYKRRWIR